MKRMIALSLIALALAASGQAADPYLALIALPNDFPAEGFAIGNGTSFYVGSFGAPDGTAGQILIGDLRTGKLSELVPPTGIQVTGMKLDYRSNLLFVCRATTGGAVVYDASTGRQVGAYQFSSAPTFINDVVLTQDAAYFTDSRQPKLYRVGLGRQGEPASDFTVIPLPADFAWPAGSGTYNPNINGNGIAASADGKFLIVVHTGKGKLYRVETSTMHVDPIALSGGDGTEAGNGDGLLMYFDTLFMVKNRQNKVAVVQMSRDYLSGTTAGYITQPFQSNPALRVPTTMGYIGNSLYVVSGALTGVPPYYVSRLDF
jgi:sugar lactone lactonase YvrE